MRAVLAPVPAVHLTSALAVCAERGRVAFGTRDTDFFPDLAQEYGAGIDVFVVATSGYGDPDGLAGRIFCSTFAGFVPADKRRGLHPDPSVRPYTTLDPADPDTPCFGFWEVSGLALLPPAVRLASFSGLSGSRLARPPRRPHFVTISVGLHQLAAEAAGGGAASWYPAPT
ncbi:hypothetical protein [Ancylobacter lacus]|uniref:hypothetical protein n=1 Tax=Ancylobacter lacus TaxID=2579970 RepID=UPI001BCDC8A1|nr:hypothetical protein [Ancylobacter lacus]MBS7539398.1 hypothetical protein [Ancylobacter lacus]